MSDFEHELVNILDEAILRVESGETLDSVLAAYPEEYRDELRDMLSVVSAFEHIAVEPVPLPSTSRRTSAKQDFLALARELKEQDVAASNTLDALPISDSNGRTNQGAATDKLEGSQIGLSSQPSNASAPQLPAISSPKEVNQEGWLKRLVASLDSIFQVPVQRLAPIAALALLAIMSLASFFTVAGAVPGDLAYPFKEWARRVELDLAPPEERAAIEAIHNEERKKEVEEAQVRVDEIAEENDDLNDSILKATMRTIYRGQGMGDLIITDATNILPRFLPDANNSDNFTEMALFGYLEPGVEIEVTYQLIPGGQKYVQGIQLTVINPPVPTLTPTSEPEVPNNQPEIVIESTPTLTSTPLCVASPDAGWVEYRVLSGDTLGAIAANRGTTASNVAARNCISNPNSIVLGIDIYVPPELVAIVQPTHTNPPTSIPLNPTARPTSSLPAMSQPAGSQPTVALPALTQPAVSPSATTLQATQTPTIDLPTPATILPTLEPTDLPPVDTTVPLTGTPVLVGGPLTATVNPTVTLPSSVVSTIEATVQATQAVSVTSTVVVTGTPVVVVTASPTYTGTVSAIIPTGITTPTATTLLTTTPAVPIGTITPQITATPEITITGVPATGIPVTDVPTTATVEASPVPVITPSLTVGVVTPLPTITGTPSSGIEPTPTIVPSAVTDSVTPAITASVPPLATDPVTPVVTAPATPNVTEAPPPVGTDPATPEPTLDAQATLEPTTSTDDSSQGDEAPNSDVDATPTTSDGQPDDTPNSTDDGNTDNGTLDDADGVDDNSNPGQIDDKPSENGNTEQTDSEQDSVTDENPVKTPDTDSTGPQVDATPTPEGNGEVPDPNGETPTKMPIEPTATLVEAVPTASPTEIEPLSRPTETLVNPTEPSSAPTENPAPTVEATTTLLPTPLPIATSLPPTPTTVPASPTPLPTATALPPTSTTIPTSPTPLPTATTLPPTPTTIPALPTATPVPPLEG
ncbi:MAG: LysM peptidoglycan-binding domain-containing protein [Chloroflexota bacterium]